MARVKTNGDTASETARATAEDAIERAGAMGEKVADSATEIGRSVVDETAEMAAAMQQRLKAVGVDTDVMIGAARDQAGELQKLVADELKARPLRALGLAAAAGLIVGYLTAR